MRVTRTTWRSGVALALLAMLTVPAAAFAAASGGRGPSAGQTATEGPPVHEGSPSSAADRVAAFYGAYVDARTGTPDTALSDALRSHFLTKEFRERLAAWERQHDTDGVFRAQNTPRGWRVSYDNSGAGHAWTQVRLTWGDEKKPTYTYLSVQSDLSTRLISDIKEAEAPAGE
ncbi:hypothetical protein AB0F13_13560 [Streptomyces sp. NPDC026206]|uniref:hypothetical protein n=1 Tax=Streptomyces sp. NPDC026206 TaxID=3157089 RepID=UPI0033C34FD7